MRATKTAALFVVVVGILFGYQAKADAAGYYWCTIGCDCNIDVWNSNRVHIDCEEVAPVDECPYDYDGASNYCNAVEGEAVNYYWSHYNQCVFAVDTGSDVDGCMPTSLEPPTHNTIECNYYLVEC
jgi:hypothetical protein